ncbi:MAG: cell division protein ZapA [bacterium]
MLQNMSDDKDTKKVEIKVFGRQFQIESDENEAYTKKIADYLSNEISAISKQAGSEKFEKIAIIAALNITDRLFKEKEKNNFIEDKVDNLLRKTGKSH